MGRINNIPVLLQIMAWRRPGGKPLSEPIMVVLPTHICVTKSQWVKNERVDRYRPLTVQQHNNMDPSRSQLFGYNPSSLSLVKEQKKMRLGDVAKPTVQQIW